METLAARLLRGRLESGLNLTQAAKATGFSRTAIRHNESGVRQPSADYLFRLSEVYNAPDLLGYCQRLRPAKGHKVYGSLGSQLRNAFKLPRPQVQLPRVEVAYKSALAYKTGRPLLDKVVSRPSQHPNRWIGMKLLARELNGLEQLSVLNLLAAGSEIDAVCPQRLGFRYPIVSQADTPQLALVLRHDDAMVALFPQLGIEVRRGLVQYVDYLAAVAVNGEHRYIDVELDSPRHDKERDKKRQERLSLPTLRYKIPQVDCFGFAQSLLRDMLAVS